MYINYVMAVKVLIADDDMDGQQLLCDVLEINFRDVRIERALCARSFYEKAAAAAAGDPWSLIFVAVGFIIEDQAAFAGLNKSAASQAIGKLVVTGGRGLFDQLPEYAKRFPYLAKPFSLDEFEEVVKDV